MLKLLLNMLGCPEEERIKFIANFKTKTNKKGFFNNLFK